MNKIKLLIIAFIFFLAIIALFLVKGLIEGDADAYIFLFLMVIIVIAFTRRKK